MEEKKRCFVLLIAERNIQLTLAQEYTVETRSWGVIVGRSCVLS